MKYLMLDGPGNGKYFEADSAAKFFFYKKNLYMVGEEEWDEPVARWETHENVSPQLCA